MASDHRLNLCLFALAILSFLLQDQARAQSPTTDKTPLRATVLSSVDGLTDEIVADQVELLRLNTSMRLSQLQNRWEQRSWFAASLANTTLTATGAYINGFGRFAYLHKKRLRRAPRDLSEHAAWFRIIANEETCAVAAGESLVLLGRGQANRRRHMDPASCRTRALQLQSSIDSLLSQRASAVMALTGAERQRADAETAVLQDVRNLSANEFARIYADGRADAVVNRVGLSVSFVANAVAGTGSIVSNHATMINSCTAHYRTRLAGTSGITDIIASAISLTGPWDQRYAGRFVARRIYERTRAKLRCGPSITDADLHAHLQALDEAASRYANEEKNKPADTRRAVFKSESAIFDQHLAMELDQKHPAKLRFADQLIVANSTAPTKMANGIGGTVATFKYTAQPHERFEAIGGPAIAYGSGYCLATAELLRNQFWFELTEAQARRAGRSTRQVLRHELDQLNKLTVAR